MSNRILFRLVERSKAIFANLSMAAGLAVASSMPAAAQVERADPPVLRLERPDRPEREAGEARPFFEKIGRQVDCDYVTYRLRFGFRGDPAFLANPAFADELKTIRMDLSDQLPDGLTVLNVQASGDGTDAAGGPLPAAAIGTTDNPNDTAELKDFRLSVDDLDGSGEVDERYVEVRIVAKIDRVAFPAPTIVDNQGVVTIQLPMGPTVDVFSHDPAVPDDGDFKTGEKTKISIDVTDCEPPPPPPPPGDGEPCFKLEEGEVDCVPGGGAFIYHMPFGAEMGGKVVQLKTTTPGILIAPASQIVPAGGGVLNWTITGALPGDVVHLIVVGVETYAGPEEGVGLCCTQTIDLVFPEDIDCPDEEREPDLKVDKRADVPFCTKDGGCNFWIRVTNVGEGPYNGKIVLDEVTLPGNASIDSGPNAPWTCLPMTSPMSCEHPATTLDPGEFVDLKIGFKPGPMWNWPAIRNCAEYDYTASEKEPFGDLTNDKACASIPICIPGRDRACTPPETKEVDLTIRKRADTPICSLDGVCLFIIDIINSGDQAINGPLTVIDTYPAGVPASSDFEPTPPWACMPTGVGQFRCDHPGVMLVPGAGTSITVKTVVGPDFRADEIENCAEVQPVPGETDLTNNKACAKARVPHRQPGQPALRITKTCEAVSGSAGYTCRITVINLGTAAPSGPVRVGDAAEIIGTGTPVQIQTVTPDGAEWTCGPVPADTLSCQIPGNLLTPGTSRHFDVGLTVSPNQRFENCARGSHGPAPGDDIVYPFGEACDQGGAAIKVEKTGDDECRTGEPCTFLITIGNDSDEPFSGPVRIGDAVELDGIGRLEGVPISSIDPPFGCSPEPATLPISCDANLSLGAGESRVHRVTIVIPDDALANRTDPVSGRNCVAVLEPGTSVRGGGVTIGRVPAGGLEADRRYACHMFRLSKEEVKECSRGFVLNDAGRCVCPEGTTFRNGQCTGGGTPPPPTPPEPEPEQCTLLPGQIRTSDGRCICPRGTELRGQRCVRTPPEQCKLLPGQIRTSDGRCICPRGTELRGQRCVRIPPEQCRLLPGQIRTSDGRCLCPRGTELRGQRCVRNPPEQCRLLPGQIRTSDGRCICPRGTELRGQRCVRTPPEQCRLLPGQIRTSDGRCICPRGTTLVRGECRKRPVECPKGTVLIRGRCLEPVDPVCRRGQVLRNGRCIDVNEPRCPRGTIGRPPNCRPLRPQNPTLQINPDTLRRLQQRSPAQLQNQ